MRERLPLVTVDRTDIASRRLFLTVEDGPDAADFVLTADTLFFSGWAGTCPPPS